MSYAAIRDAVQELLLGTIGTTRTVAVGTFAEGAHEGRTLSGQQAEAVIKPRFSVRILGWSSHPSTPSGYRGSYRLDQLTVTIRLTYHLPHEIKVADRDAIYDALLSDGDTVWQAIARPGNLGQTAGGTDTGLVGGLLEPEAYDITSEDWDGHLLQAELRATGVVRVTQAVA